MEQSSSLEAYLESAVISLSTSANMVAVFSVGDLALRFPSTGENPLPEEDIFVIREALCSKGLASEPDISKCYRRLDYADPIAIYVPSSIASYPVSYVIREKIFFSSLALIAKADGQLTKDEREYIDFCRRYRAAQSGVELSRICAISELALMQRRSELIGRLQSLRTHFASKDEVLDFFANIIISDGHIDKAEVEIYCTIFEIMIGEKLSFPEAKTKLEKQAASLHKRISKQPQTQQFSNEETELPAIEEDLLSQILADF